MHDLLAFKTLSNIEGWLDGCVNGWKDRWMAG